MVFVMKHYTYALLVLLLFWITVTGNALALEKPGEELKDVGLATELGAQVDTSLTFTNSEGKLVALSELISESIPTIIIPAYYDCPMLCGLLLNGVIKLINRMDLVLGTDYRIVTVSFDSSETAKQAADRKAEFVEKFVGQGDAKSGWDFLVGTEENVKTLMGQIGFYYKEDKEEFAHTAVIMLLTPAAKISQYFTGIGFPEWDVRLALIEASQGSIGSAIDHVLLYCFRFDPLKGRYTWVATGVMRAGGVATLLLLGGLLLFLWKREKNSAASNGRTSHNDSVI